jgi:hypothetical protein
MADWEHKDATWFWDSGQDRFQKGTKFFTWKLRLWISDDGSPSIVDKNWHLELSPDANESQKESFNAEVEKINKEFSEILPLQVKFSEWLNLQTKGGWEVFKISRRESGTWCVFRRKTE